MVEHGDGGALSACDPIRRDAADRVQPLEFVGPVPFKPLEELQRADFLAGLCNKVLGQVEIVRQGIPYVTDGGSFTLTTGVVGREPVRTGASAALVNGALEYFVPAAAVELPRGLRINAVSPTVLREAPEYHSTFPDSSRSRRRP